MTFSYSGALSGSVINQVRFLVGDTESAEALLQDEEITFLDTLWTTKNSVYYTASMAAEAIAARFAREITVNSDGQTLSTSELQDKYTVLAQRLMGLHQQLLAGGFVDVGGILAGEQPDVTLLPLAFGTGMHDSVEVGQQDYGDYANRPSYPENWWY